MQSQTSHQLPLRRPCTPSPSEEEDRWCNAGLEDERQRGSFFRGQSLERFSVYIGLTSSLIRTLNLRIYALPLRLNRSSIQIIPTWTRLFKRMTIPPRHRRLSPSNHHPSCSVTYQRRVKASTMSSGSSLLQTIRLIPSHRHAATAWISNPKPPIIRTLVEVYLRVCLPRQPRVG